VVVTVAPAGEPVTAIPAVVASMAATATNAPALLRMRNFFILIRALPPDRSQRSPRVADPSLRAWTAVDECDPRPEARGQGFRAAFVPTISDYLQDT